MMLFYLCLVRDTCSINPLLFSFFSRWAVSQMTEIQIKNGNRIFNGPESGWSWLGMNDSDSKIPKLNKMLWWFFSFIRTRGTKRCLVLCVEPQRVIKNKEKYIKCKHYGCGVQHLFSTLLFVEPLFSMTCQEPYAAKRVSHTVDN